MSDVPLRFGNKPAVSIIANNTLIVKEYKTLYRKEKIANEYREDIDGLRAVAVILVLLAHFHIPLFKGGFIGVDIFFVISGFVITNLICNRINSHTFSLRRFYINRVKRLAPALIVMLYFSLIAFWSILAPKDLEKAFASVVWINGYLGNVFLWLNYGGYFSESASSAPFLHTWSLAIEEQFYLIWPFILLLLFKLQSKRTILCIVTLLVLGSSILSEVALDYTFGAAYYLLPTRAFELGVGCLIGICGPISLRSVRAANFISLMTLSTLFAISIFYNESTPFPGLNALVVCLGSGLFICFYNRDSYGYRFMCLPPIQSIGKMSYSVYLWHWPVITWITYRYVEPPSLIIIVALSLTVVFAYLSWRFVENPFRNKARLSDKSVLWFLIIIPLTLSFAFSIIVNKNNGFPERFNTKAQMLDKSIVLASNVLREHCHSSLKDAKSLPNPECVLGSKMEETSGLLLGDSHANHLVGFIDVIAREKKISVMDYTLDQCLPIFDIEWGTSYPRAKACSQRNSIARAYIEESDIDIVYLAGSWPNYGTRSLYKDGKIVEKVDEKFFHFRNALFNTIEFLTTKGIQVVLFKDTAYYPKFDPLCPIKSEMFERERKCSFPHLKNEMMESITKEILVHFPITKVNVIDPKQFYCSEAQCLLEIDQTLIYIDGDHISYPASRLLGQKYLDSL